MPKKSNWTPPGLLKKGREKAGKSDEDDRRGGRKHEDDDHGLKGGEKHRGKKHDGDRPGKKGDDDHPEMKGPKPKEIASYDRESKTLGFELDLTFDSEAGEEGAEVALYFDGRVYVTNSADDAVDVFDAFTGDKIFSIDLTNVTDYDGVNSVDVTDDGVAVAIGTTGAERAGLVARFELDGTPIDEIEVGKPGDEGPSLPDMVTYSADGTQLFVALEGEPDGDDDPAGGIAIVDVATGAASFYGFEEFDDQVDELRAGGVRIFPDPDNPGEFLAPSVDFEPEYITQKGDQLFVTLQEANAVAIFDLDEPGFVDVVTTGTTDYSAAAGGPKIDVSDKGPNGEDDGQILLRNAPIFGMRMPDALVAFQIGDETYYATANEGDDRGEDERVRDLALDPAAFPDATTLQQDGELGRLNVSSIDGDEDGDGVYEELFAYGSRSFSIFDAEGNEVFDSGDEFERIIEDLAAPAAFNNPGYDPDQTDQTTVSDGRSDNKGPEPEAIDVGRLGDVTLAFIGLERVHGIMIYDVSDPENAQFVDYIDNRAFGNEAPETIQFVPGEEFDDGVARILVANEVSGTSVFYKIELGKKIIGTNRKDKIEGGIGDDLIKAGNGKDKVYADDGDDVLRGGNGKDCLFGGDDDDLLFGQNGKDKLVGGTGDDVLNGGRGKDRYVVEVGDGDDEISLLQNKERIDVSDWGVSSFEDLIITDVSRREKLVENGEGDSIIVNLARNNRSLDDDDFMF